MSDEITTPESGTANVSESGESTLPESNPSFLESIPEEYRSKGWMTNINSLDDLLKKHENVQTLIGKKTIGVPEETATEEQWNEFYTKIRPEKPDAYELSDIKFPEGKEAIKDILDSSTTPEYMAKVREIFHKAGLSKKQAAELYSEYSQLMVESNAKVYDDYLALQKKLDVDFEAEGREKFKDNYERTMELGEAFITEHVDPSFKEYLKGLIGSGDEKLQVVANKTLLALAQLGASVKNKYGVEDPSIVTRTGGSMSVNTPKERAEAMAVLMAEFKQTKDPAKRSEIQAQMNSLYIK